MVASTTRGDRVAALDLHIARAGLPANPVNLGYMTACVNAAVGSLWMGRWLRCRADHKKTIALPGCLNGKYGFRVRPVRVAVLSVSARWYRWGVGRGVLVKLVAHSVLLV